MVVGATCRLKIEVGEVGDPSQKAMLRNVNVILRPAGLNKRAR